jgi:hypothetical protein
LVRVECRANGRAGISVSGVSRVSIRDSTCYDNGRAQLRAAGLARVSVERCELDRKDADAPWIEMRGRRVSVDGKPVGGVSDADF